MPKIDIDNVAEVVLQKQLDKIKTKNKATLVLSQLPCPKGRGFLHQKG